MSNNSSQNNIPQDEDLCNGSEGQKRVLRVYIESVLKFRSHGELTDYLDAPGMWLYRKLLRTSWTDNKSNEDMVK